MSYTNIFGGKPIQPADVSYRRIDLTDNVTLSWPSSYLDTIDVVAKLMDVTSDNIFHNIIMPPATQVSVGETIIFKNIGANNFTVKNSILENIILIGAGQAFYVYLTDNTTDAGVWGITQYGTGTSQADATTLAGFGLIPLDGKLNTQFASTQIDDNYIVSLDDRSKFFTYVGGQAAFILPTPGVAGNGFFFSIHNASPAGALTFIPDGAGVLIDGFSTFTIKPTESCTFITNGTNWFSLGYGKPTLFTVSILNEDLGPLQPSHTLSTVEANRLIHQFYGVLIGNITVNYPVGIAGQFYISNMTTGGYNIILTIPGSSNPIQLTPDSSVIVYSDGVDLHSVPTEIPGSLAFFDGTAANPSIRFEGDLTTGLYLDSPGNLGITISANTTVIIDSNDLASFVPINSFNGGYYDFGINIYSLIRAYDNG